MGGATFGVTATFCGVSIGVSAAIALAAEITVAAGAIPCAIARSCTSIGLCRSRMPLAWATSLSSTRRLSTVPPRSTV